MSDSPLPPDNLPPTVAGHLGRVLLLVFLVGLALMGVLLIWGVSDPEILLKSVATFTVVAVVTVLLAMVLQKRSENAILLSRSWLPVRNRQNIYLSSHPS